MKILFIAEVGSIHTARWVNQLAGTGWDYRVFQPVPSSWGARSEFQSGHLYLPYRVSMPASVTAEYTLTPRLPALPARLSRKVRRASLSALKLAARTFRKALRLLKVPLSAKSPFMKLLTRIIEQNMQDKIDPVPDSAHASYLARVIREWRPDVIHSLGMFVNWRDNSRILFEARRILGGKFPCPWVVSTWGPDLDVYPQMGDREQGQATAILSTCEGLVIEGERDIGLAQELGFRGRIFAKLPAFGGVTWAQQDYASSRLPSSRRVILLKGRDNSDGVLQGGDPQGRAMTAMKAFEQCTDLLEAYSLVIAQATPAVVQRAKSLARLTGRQVVVYPNSISLPYQEWLKLMGSARVMIAVTASDGLPSTLVEAMSLGAFPIHSSLETVSEWIRDGRNGLLVQPEDVDGVVRALHLAVADDQLVNRAAELNAKIVAEHFSDAIVRPQTIDLYKTIVDLRHQNKL